MNDKKTKKGGFTPTPECHGCKPVVWGFTLMELLIVIAIIALVSMLAVTAVRNAREKAKIAKLKADFKQIYTAIEQARELNNKVLKDVTGSAWSCGACLNQGNLSLLPDSHQCIINYKNWLAN